MFAIINYLQQHDLGLVAWAVAISVCAVSVSLHALRQATLAQGGRRRAWTIMVALLLGSGVWATHFLAMLAYHHAHMARFGLNLTALSYLVAVGGIGIGASVAASGPSLRGRILGGLLCGAGIAAMHFTGVLAMHLPAEMLWSPPLVALAVLVCLGAAAGAMVLAGGEPGLGPRLSAIAAMVTAICGVHFIGMAAITLAPTAGAAAASGLQGGQDLAPAIGALVGLILTAGVAMIIFDRFAGTLSSLRSALDSAPAAIAAFDGEGRLTFWSRSYATFLEAYGLTARHGLPLRHMLARCPMAVQARAWDPAQTTVHTYDLIAPDGRCYHGQMQTDRDGGHVVVLTDVTDRQELARREAEARQLAESANAAKSEFLANMSHEIRTPLNGVLGMVQVMARDPMEPEQRKRLEVIGDAGKSLLALLNNILDLSKIEAGKLEHDRYAFDVETMVRQATAAHAPLAAQKDIALSVHIAPAAQGAWMGDGAKLRQVLTNLVSNALKFTSEGSIEVLVRRAPNGLAFEITDTGIGIAPDKLDLVFEKFAQADASTTRRFGGTGLGLAICRELIEFMGGALAVESAEGQGSTFRFAVPLAPAANPAAPPPRSEVPAPTGVALRILAAEDNPTNQLILRALLEPLEIDLRIVGNGREAVEACAEGVFDLILMDAQMPEMSGVEATAAIRRRERTTLAPRVPIIALTANVMRHQIDAYMGAGMDACVAKPIDATALFQTMEQVLEAPQAA